MQERLLFGEGFVDDAMCGGVHARIGDVVQPAAQLRIEVFEIVEDAAEKEVLADITKGPLDLAFGLGPIGRQARGWKP